MTTTMTTRDENHKKINGQLQQVASDNFDFNRYAENEYNEVGFKTKYNFLFKNKFRTKAKNGKQNDIIKQDNCLKPHD